MMEQKNAKTPLILWGVLALVVLGCAVWLLLPHGGGAATAEIWVDNVMVRSIPLAEAADEEIPLEQYGVAVTLTVKGHRISFAESNCPDKICVKTGWVAAEGQTAVCLPNRVSIILTEGGTTPVVLD